MRAWRPRTADLLMAQQMQHPHQQQQHRSCEHSSRRCWHAPQRRCVAAAARRAPPGEQLRGARAAGRDAGPEEDEWAVATENLQVSFAVGGSSKPVLKGVDLRIRRGSLHMLLGPNGCGKSTLLKVLGGLVPAAGGRVRTDLPTGFVFQNPDHQVVMPTVAADVAFGLGRYDLAESRVSDVVTSALELVNMQEAIKRATHTLSGGQRQRVAIAGALAENPRLLLLDELTTFLDVEDQFGVLEAVQRVTRRGCVTTVAAASRSQSPPPSSSSSSSSSASDGESPGQPGKEPEAPGGGDQPVTAVWVTHRFEELEYADAASYMQDGRVAFTGSAQEMRRYLKQLGAPV